MDCKAEEVTTRIRTQAAKAEEVEIVKCSVYKACR